MTAEQTSAKPLVLVTGGTGFIAAYCIARLLEEGYRVRATARSTDRAAALRETVGRAGQDASGVEVVAADLNNDAGWPEAVAGVDAVLHVASPIPHTEPKDPEEVIRPAREGALRVLRAADAAGVKRLVLTSAFGAIGFGWGPTDHVFTEADWSKLDGPGVSTYDKSKTLAEQAAWKYVEEEGRGIELVALCPTAVFGPILGTTVSGGNEVVRRMLSGQLPVILDMWFPVVDVRDVAAAQVAAVSAPQAAGKRIIVGADQGMTMGEIARTLKEGLGERAAKVPTRTVPNWLIRGLAKVVPAARDFAQALGTSKNIDASRAREILGLRTRPARETILATAESMFARGVVQAPKGRRK